MATVDDLFDAARAMQARAYVPYSRFKVGAAIATPDGQVFSGCNVENAAYPVGSCAEASAISAMVGAGQARIAEILVIGDGDALVTPAAAAGSASANSPGRRRRSTSPGRKAPGPPSHWPTFFLTRSGRSTSMRSEPRTSQPP